MLTQNYLKSGKLIKNYSFRCLMRFLILKHNLRKLLKPKIKLEDMSLKHRIIKILIKYCILCQTILIIIIMILSHLVYLKDLFSIEILKVVKLCSLLDPEIKEGKPPKNPPSLNSINSLYSNPIYSHLHSPPNHSPSD